MSHAQEAHLEMWAGLECTLNRVNDSWINQEDKNGHKNRLVEDIALFGTLGVTRTRYPCLWELVAPESPEKFRWDDLDQRLAALRSSQIEIIATFLHHGSGPSYTSLIDEQFPEKLEMYARAFIERYPWVKDFTPINEINTTTRFSLHYGHWYPHHKNDHRGYVRSLYIQCRATILSMRAIRKVNPEARLIQTDDLGKCQARPGLRAQADFENHRRWLSWDMLCGMIDEDHPLYSYLLKSGLAEHELRWLRENRCPPDVIGVNHYHLSNRYLDERLELYPAEYRMDNGERVYADIGAIDNGEAIDIPLPETLMRETWERYHLPVAITEVHMMSERASQMRWLFEVWQSAKKVRQEGVDVIAVTVWSLLGTYDWHKLCTICELFYEPGVFDLRSPDKKPRYTGLSTLVTDLATKGNSDHPILKEEGWWRTDRRFRFNVPAGAQSALGKQVRPILIAGKGKLGFMFARALGERNISYILAGREELDISRVDVVRAFVRHYRPWAIVNAAGFSHVSSAETSVEKCFRENVLGPQILSLVCAESGIPLIHFSSAQVFDGEKESPYLESDIPSPINVYGHSKAESEKAIMSIHGNSLIVRTSTFFSALDHRNFVTDTLTKLSRENEVTAASDAFLSPTYIPDLALASLDLLLDRVTGVVHLTNKGSLSWSDFAKLAAEVGACKLKLDPTKIRARPWKEMNRGVKKPRNSALSSQHYEILPTVEDALIRYIEAL